MRLAKACAVPFALSGSTIEVLAFRHPFAGKQLVKGSIELGERPGAAAVRELREESGLALPLSTHFLGQRAIGDPAVAWHIFALSTDGLPRNWRHRTDDGGGLVFEFFWHPLNDALDADWHPMFHAAFLTIRAALPLAVRRNLVPATPPAT